MRDLFPANYFLRPYDPLQGRRICCFFLTTNIFSIYSVSSAPVKLGKPTKIVLDVMNLSSVLKNVPVEPFLYAEFLSAAEPIYHSGRQFLEVSNFHEKFSDLTAHIKHRHKQNEAHAQVSCILVAFMRSVTFSYDVI